MKPRGERGWNRRDFAENLLRASGKSSRPQLSQAASAATRHSAHQARDLPTPKMETKDMTLEDFFADTDDDEKASQGKKETKDMTVEDFFASSDDEEEDDTPLEEAEAPRVVDEEADLERHRKTQKKLKKRLLSSKEKIHRMMMTLREELTDERKTTKQLTRINALLGDEDEIVEEDSPMEPVAEQIYTAEEEAKIQDLMDQGMSRAEVLAHWR